MCQMDNFRPPGAAGFGCSVLSVRLVTITPVTASGHPPNTLAPQQCTSSKCTPECVVVLSRCACMNTYQVRERFHRVLARPNWCRGGLQPEEGIPVTLQYSLHILRGVTKHQRRFLARFKHNHGWGNVRECVPRAQTHQHLATLNVHLDHVDSLNSRLSNVPIKRSTSHLARFAAIPRHPQ